LRLSQKALFLWCPQAFAVHCWRQFFAAKIADYVFGGHAPGCIN
jgi:hypothetical protein